MKKIAVLFGGKSPEHNVSIVSGTSVLYNLDRKKYEIYPIYISKEGLFYKYNKNIKDIQILSINDEIKDIELIDNITEYLKVIDIVFPVLHGTNGEDGTIQGMLELLGKKYVGCKVLSSSICMDKIYTKKIIKNCNIEQAKYMYIKKRDNKYIYIDETFNREEYNIKELMNLVKKLLKFPVFIKPSNSGSSVGISKCIKEIELDKCLKEAFKYDDKVIIEENIKGREVECAILGTENPLASNIGEVKASKDFYSYDSKYKDKESFTIIPANIDEKVRKEIQSSAAKAYLACDCKGLSRIDFFIEDKTNRIILNEINTIPGFTDISMYPKLIENIGINFTELLDRLIELA